jgi:nardilysin
MKFSRLWNERWIRKEFSLPHKNRFICKKFEICAEPNVQNFGFPIKIYNSDNCKCFFKPDDKFNLPHGFINIHFKSSLTESSVTNLNMTAIYSMCIKNFLSEKLYPATIAGYNYKLYSVDNGLILRLWGFNEKLPMMVDLITKAITNVDGVVDSSIFETFRKELKKNCYNLIINSNMFIE